MLFTIIQVIQDAINDIVSRYQKMMMTIANSIINDYQLAEDITQLSLLRINKNLSKIDNVNSDRTKNFIITITRHVAFSMKKNKKSFQEYVQFCQEEEFNNIIGEIDLEVFRDKYGFSEEIAEALNSLGELNKDIIIFRFWAGYSCKEIADIFEMTQESVYKRVERSKTKLKEILDGQKEKGKGNE